MESFRIAAAVSLPSTEDVPDRIVYLPEGEHEIQASVNGKPGKRKIKVGPEALEPLQAALQKRLSANVRPFGGFDHEENGPASFIPKAFHYEAGRGIVAEVEWTKSGREAISGKDYSYFSPSFIVANGKIAGLPEFGEIGSLVNEPAFRSIQRIAASNKPSDTMDIKDLTDELAKSEHLAAALKDKEFSSAEELANVIKARLDEIKAESVVTPEPSEDPAPADPNPELAQRIATLEAEKTALEEKLKAKREAEADEAIGEAIKAGRIPPQDEEAKKFWRASILADESGLAKKQLAAIPGNDALKGDKILAGRKHDGKELTGLARAIAAHKSK